MSEVRITVNADGSWVHHTVCSYDLSETPTVIKALQSCVLNMAEDHGKRVDDIVREIQAEHDSAADVARLRKALERISAILPCSEPCKPRVMCGACHRGDDTDGEIDCTGCIARAALGRTTK